MHDQTAAKTESIADLLGQRPTVNVWVGDGYRGLATAIPDQVHAPPHKPSKDAPAEQVIRYEQARRTQSSRRIRVEHGRRSGSAAGHCRSVRFCGHPICGRVRDRRRPTAAGLPDIGSPSASVPSGQLGGH
jgi:hypothetical protein